MAKGSARPNWAVWSALSRVKVWQGVALSLDVEPTNIRCEDLETARRLDTWASLGGFQGSTYLPVSEGALILDYRIARQFNQRVAAVMAELDALRPHPKDGDADPNADSYVSLPTLAAWAVGLGWSVPPEFAALVQTASVRSSAGPRGRSRVMSRAPKIVLPYDTPHLTVEEMPRLIADALHPVPEGVDNGSMTEALQRAIAEEEHGKHLSQAIYCNQLVVRNRASRVPLPPLAIPTAVVLLEDFAVYVEQFGIDVVIDFVCISDILPALGSAIVDANRGSWQKEGHDNDVRRSVANAFAILHLQQLVKDMVDSGSIVPINGRPANGELIDDAPWGVSRADAEQLRTSLPVDLPGPVWAEINEKADEKAARDAQYVRQNEAKRAAGRYTILEACAELARATEITADRWKQVMLDDIRAAMLALRNPQNYTDRLPYPVPKVVRPYYDQVDAESLNRWLDEHPEWTQYRFQAFASAPNSKVVVASETVPQSIDPVLVDIQQAYDALHAKNRKAPSQRAVAKRSGYSRDTISSRWLQVRKTIPPR